MFVQVPFEMITFSYEKEPCLLTRISYKLDISSLKIVRFLYRKQRAHVIKISKVIECILNYVVDIAILASSLCTRANSFFQAYATMLQKEKDNARDCETVV